MAIVIELSARLTNVLTRRLGTHGLTSCLTRRLGTQTECTAHQRRGTRAGNTTRRSGIPTLRNHRQTSGVEDDLAVLTRWLKPTLTEIAQFAALASTEVELNEFFVLCKLSELANELALTCKIAVRRDQFNPSVKLSLFGTIANKPAHRYRAISPRSDTILTRRLKSTIVVRR